jgi:Iap family predicted aminopeptidase
MLDPQVIQQRLEMAPRSLVERKATLISLFRDAGCEVTEQRVPRSSKAGNLICTLPGEGQSAIVVGGHFDFIKTGTGAIDDWSGAVMLPSLYQSLKSHPRHHRYIFIAFAEEETGLWGSAEYVKKLSPDEKRSIHAMINLECLGTNPPKVWATRADKDLLRAYIRVARSLQLEPVASNVDKVGDDDSHSFKDAKIPVLTIHSLTTETFRLLHSPRDTVQAIHPDDYYISYRLATVLLSFLDTVVE